MNEEIGHFSLRKLSVGLASVLVGVSIFGASQTVKADTLNNSAIIQTSKASAAQNTNVPKAKDASVQISNPQTKEELTKIDAQSSAPQTKDIYIYAV